jgi:hypothetical protein
MRRVLLHLADLRGDAGNAALRFQRHIVAGIGDDEIDFMSGQRRRYLSQIEMANDDVLIRQRTLKTTHQRPPFHFRLFRPQPGQDPHAHVAGGGQRTGAHRKQDKEDSTSSTEQGITHADYVSRIAHQAAVEPLADHQQVSGKFEKEAEIHVDRNYASRRYKKAAPCHQTASSSPGTSGVATSAL